MKRKLTAIIMTAILAIGMIGCGSTTGGSTTSTKAKEEKVLKVGTDATFQPFEYKEGDVYKGFDIELVNALAKEMDYDSVEFVNTDFKGLIPGLLSKKFDMIASAMYVTDERKESINFSDSYYPGGLCILVGKDDNSINSIEDLKGKNIAVQVGTKSIKYLSENYPDIQRVEVETNNEMFLQLETGKVDAVVTGKPAAQVYAKQSGKVKIVDKSITEELYAFGLRKEDEALTKEVNTALKTLKENGEYDKIKANYFE